MATVFGTHPKFEKRMHHVVPASWQRRFAKSGDSGPFYKNILSGQNFSAQGPGDKMAEEYVNIVFDSHFRPSDKLEDSLSLVETKAIRSLDRTIATSSIDSIARVDLAYFLAIQACRYPEHFRRRLDLGRYLAIALKDYSSCPDAATLNKSLRSTGIFPGANITPEEFHRLKSTPEADLASEVDGILGTHGYEAHFNPELVMAGALPVAMHLLGLQWQLIESSAPAFLLCDRPVPTPIKYGFDISLSARFGLKLSKPTSEIDDGPIQSQSASSHEIDNINNSMRSRAQTWICGPGPWIYSL